MAEATKKATNGNGAKGDGAKGEEAVMAEAARSTSYAVFLADGAALKPGDKITFLGFHDAPDRQLARWAAVDADPALAERVRVPQGSKEGGLYLVAVAARMASSERTVEEVVTSTIRR